MGSECDGNTRFAESGSVERPGPVDADGGRDRPGRNLAEGQGRGRGPRRCLPRSPPARYAELRAIATGGGRMATTPSVLATDFADVRELAPSRWRVGEGQRIARCSRSATATAT